MNRMQKRFCQEYIIDLNGSAAAVRAGYSKTRSRQKAYELLSKSNISEEIRIAQKDREDRTKITQDMVLKEYAKLAFVDPRKFFDENDNLRKITELDDNTAACVAGMDIQTVQNEDSASTVKKIKLTDKKSALDSVARHLGMFEKDNLQRKTTFPTKIKLRYIDAEENNG